MFYRSISAALKKRDWFAVGVDFVIVVAGVFLDFQMNALYENNRIRGENASFAANLQSDIDAELQSYDILIGYFSAVSDAAHRAIGHFENNTRMSDEAFLIAAYTATQYVRVDEQDATFDMLVNTGRIDGIQPPSLMRMLILHYASQNRLILSNSVLESGYRSRLRQVMPFTVQAAIRANCGDIRDGRGYPVGIETDCELSLPESEIQAAATILMEDAELVGLLRVLIPTVDAYIEDNRADQVFMIRTLEDVGQ